MSDPFDPVNFKFGKPRVMVGVHAFRKLLRTINTEANREQVYLLICNHYLAHLRKKDGHKI